MPVTRVTASTFQKEYGRYASLAKRYPITITNHGRDELVILPADEYARLLQLGQQTADAAKKGRDKSTAAPQSSETQTLASETGRPSSKNQKARKRMFASK